MKTHEEWKNQTRTALALFNRHNHNKGDTSPLTRENCGACTLSGYHPKGERRDFINYAGWARVYIQAGKFIPKNLHYDFLAELASDNRAYADALTEDIRHYGINCENGSFKNAVRSVLGIYD